MRKGREEGRKELEIERERERVCVCVCMYVLDEVWKERKRKERNENFLDA